jgi:hypothetical protein
MTLLEIKQLLRHGQYAWPGGYSMYFVTHDGAALSFDAVRQEWRQVVQDHLWARRPGFRGTGWLIEGYAINWEDGELTCEHTGKRIESAYAED